MSRDEGEDAGGHEPSADGRSPAGKHSARAHRQDGADSPYLEAVRMLRAPAPAPLPAGHVANGWRPLGPFSIPHGQTYGSGPGSRPSVSGRVSSMAVDPANAAHLLVGAAGGGVWESRDDGATWTPRTDDQPTLTTGAIAFDPANSAIVYAGTGEGDFYAALGAGLLRSMDGGRSWAIRTRAPFVGQGFYDLLVDPANSNHLVAGTTSQLCESSDAGATWAVRRNRRTWAISKCPAIVGNPAAANEVFAACSDGVFRSTDGGTTWNAVALPGAPTALNRIEVRHAPSNGNVAYVFAAGGATAYVWRRDTFAGAFTAEAAPPGISTNQAWYDWFAGVAPNDPNVLYVGAIDVHKGVRSATGAWTWSKISARSTGQSIHPDQHAIAFSPANPNVLYVGNDGGVYRSPDGGATWRSLNKGLCITEFEYLAQHPHLESWLIGGTQDNGTMRYEGGEVWPHVADGDGGDCAVNSASPYTCFHTYYGMGMERSTAGGAWGTYSWIGPNVPAGYGALFYPPMEASGSVVAQAGQSAFISTNSGSSWTEVALPSGTASAIVIPTPTRVYVATMEGDVHRIDLAGTTWGPATTLTRPRAGYVSDVAVDPANPNRLWVTYSSRPGGRVFRSDDGGNAWTDVSAGLPDVAANAIVLDPADGARVYVGMDVGVWRSFDAGAHWHTFSNGLPNALVGDLLFHAPTRLLRAGTRNRGAWEISADAISMPGTELYLRDSVVDTGRRFPSASGVSDPFQPGIMATWADCTDLKIESVPFQTPSLLDVDFERFEDDRGVFASGLQTEYARSASRVFVQVHNRGPNPATGGAVKVFWADGGSLPPLPAGFWTNFPNNALPQGSPWQPIAPHKVLPLAVETARPQVVGFDWNAPSGTSGGAWLLAVATAASDPAPAGVLDVTQLVRSGRFAGLKWVRVLPYTRVQFTGTVAANSTQRWFTHSWPAAWHVLWTVVPVTSRPGGPAIRWKVRVERASNAHATYWIEVTNVTPQPLAIEARYCVFAI